MWKPAIPGIQLPGAMQCLAVPAGTGFLGVVAWQTGRRERCEDSDAGETRSH
jgi:hypothetical protein